MVQEIEDFFGVYILYNINPKYKGRIYIGYTVDPNRRIKQHNLGRHAGGACRTDGKGPWDMVLITHGFPNEISALRFEWALQHPEKSRRLRHVAKKKKKETSFEFRFRILSEMLRTGPWNRLSLTIRWLKQEYKRDFAPDLSPPLHMAIAYGLVKPKKVKAASATDTAGGDTVRSETGTSSTGCDEDDELSIKHLNKRPRCAVCCKLFQVDDKQTLSCINPQCSMQAHTICLARKFLCEGGEDSGQIIPVSGSCPRCRQPALWGDLIRHKRGCYQNLSESTHSDDSEEDHWANELQTQVT